MRQEAERIEGQAIARRDNPMGAIVCVYAKHARAAALPTMQARVMEI